MSQGCFTNPETIKFCNANSILELFPRLWTRSVPVPPNPVRNLSQTPYTIQCTRLCISRPTTKSRLFSICYTMHRPPHSMHFLFGSSFQAPSGAAHPLPNSHNGNGLAEAFLRHPRFRQRPETDHNRFIQLQPSPDASLLQQSHDPLHPLQVLRLHQHRPQTRHRRSPTFPRQPSPELHRQFRHRQMQSQPRRCLKNPPRLRRNLFQRIALRYEHQDVQLRFKRHIELSATFDGPEKS
jgi:hypothetical protein